MEEVRFLALKSILRILGEGRDASVLLNLHVISSSKPVQLVKRRVKLLTTIAASVAVPYANQAGRLGSIQAVAKKKDIKANEPQTAPRKS
jgi:hypothetical protein